jgi:hypothetical protein
MMLPVRALVVVIALLFCTGGGLDLPQRSMLHASVGLVPLELLAAPLRLRRELTSPVAGDSSDVLEVVVVWVGGQPAGRQKKWWPGG